MVLSWTSGGALTVDRSIITSGYPGGTIETIAIEPGISVTEIDNDSNDESFDTLRVNFDRELHYYIIPFDPNAGGGGGNGIIGDPYGFRLKCGCSSGGGSCTLRSSGPAKYYCAGCTKCEISNKLDYSPVSSGDYPVPKGGIYLVEATSITVIH